MYIVPAVAQTDPTDPAPPGIDLSLFWVSIISLTAIVMPLSGWIISLIKLDGAASRFVSWAVAILLSYTGYWMNFGFWADMGPITTALTGLGMGLVSNGVFTMEWVQAVLTAIGAKLPKHR